MKKVISLILLIGMVFMLEFNLLQAVFPGSYTWIEPVVAFIILAVLMLWNDLFSKSKS